MSDKRTFARMLTREKLMQLDYRQLQQIAKANGIPCNIKKCHLQEAVYLSYHGTSDEVKAVLSTVARERKADKRNKEIRNRLKPALKFNPYTKIRIRQFNPINRLNLNLFKDTTIEVVNQKTPKKTAPKTMNIYKRAMEPITYTHPKQPKEEKLATNQRKYDIIPCNKVLRNKVYPIYDKLRKKSVRKSDTNENIVSSSGDIIATRSVLRRMVDDREEEEYAAPNVAVYVEHHGGNEPVDFTLKTPPPDALDNNKVDQNYAYHQKYFPPYYQTQSQSMLMYRQVSRTENYEPRPVNENIQNEMTVYTQDQYHNHIYAQRQYLSAHNTYEYQYAEGPSNYPDLACNYIATNNENERYAYQTQGTVAVQPYFHKKIRIERRQSEYREVRNQESVYYDQNAYGIEYETPPYESRCERPEEIVQTYNYPDSLIVNNPDSTVNDLDVQVHCYERNNIHASTGIYEPMTNVAPLIRDTIAYIEEPCGQEPYDSPYGLQGCRSYGRVLPPINEVFPTYCKATQTTYERMQPLYVQVGENELRADRHEIAIQTDEASYREETLLKIAPIPKDIIQTDDQVQVMVRLETVPHVEAEGGLTDLDTIVSHIHSPWSDIGASVTVKALSPSWDDVMGLISQDGEIIVTDHVNSVQCVCCDWNGEAALLEHHLKQEHLEKITKCTAKISSIRGISLGSLLRDKRHAMLLEWHGRLMVLLIKYEDPEWLLASLALLSHHSDAPLLQASITVYNKSSGEPFTWEGTVLKSNLIFYSNPTAHLKLQLSQLGLVPKDAEVLWWNGQFKPSSPNSKSICGNAALDEVLIEFHIEITC